jgi:hypothetical protein
MPVTGYLSNFSLSEVLQFAQEGNKTGLLTIRSLPNSTHEFHSYFIWLNQGRIIAAADRTDYQGLANMIIQRKWIAERQLQSLIQQCPLRTPLGIYLKSQNLLSAEQMKLLFSVQIIRQICALFELIDGSFHLTSNVQMPYSEMTGINIQATDVTLPGLRNLKNWSALQEKLPQSMSGLLATVQGMPTIQLNAQERQLWEFTNGQMTIAEIAKRLDRTIEEIQRTAFCLTVAGLAEEIPFIKTESSAKDLELQIMSQHLPSSGFLKHMKGFFKKQVKSESTVDF